jgi:polysaccharide deacetylase family protein (PEP-CTERM system associated)
MSSNIRADVPAVKNVFTVDVEDYFQVEAFRSLVDFESWNSWPARVQQNTERVLDILGKANTRATFFVLGWVAERHPNLIRRMIAEGHEVASHGYAHRPVHSMSRDEFRDDLRRSKAVLEECSGLAIRGFRAPTFSISRATWWAYDVLQEEGFAYSSSVYPIAHDLYGIPDAPRTPFYPVDDGGILEIPIATVRLLSRNGPCGGGGYFRLLPYSLSRWCIGRTNARDGHSCVFYCHPWEFDPGQPRMHSVSAASKFRHYVNIPKMEQRIVRLLRDFSWTRMDSLFLQAA